MIYTYQDGSYYQDTLRVVLNLLFDREARERERGEGEADLDSTVLARSSMDASLADGVGPVADCFFADLIVVLNGASVDRQRRAKLGEDRDLVSATTFTRNLLSLSLTHPPTAHSERLTVERWTVEEGPTRSGTAGFFSSCTHTPSQPESQQ